MPCCSKSTRRYGWSTTLCGAGGPGRTTSCPRPALCRSHHSRPTGVVFTPCHRRISPEHAHPSRPAGAASIASHQCVRPAHAHHFRLTRAALFIYHRHHVHTPQSLPRPPSSWPAQQSVPVLVAVILFHPFLLSSGVLTTVMSGVVLVAPLWPLQCRVPQSALASVPSNGPG